MKMINARNLRQLARNNRQLRFEIEERKKIEKRLEAEREQLFHLLEAFPAFVYVQRPDYGIEYTNRLVRDLFGEPGGKQCFELFHGRATPCEACPTFKVFETGKVEEWDFTDAKGQTFRIYDYPFYAVDGSPLVLELGVNISDIRKAESILKNSESTLRQMLNSVTDAIIVHHMNGRIIYINDRALEMFAISEKQALKLNFYQDLTSPVTSERRLGRGLEKIKRGGNGFFEWEAKRPADGSFFKIEVSMRRIELNGESAILTNLCDSSRQRHSLHEWNRLVTAIEQTGEGIIVTDKKGIINYVNPAMEKLSGYTADEVIGRRIHMLREYSEMEASRKIMDRLARKRSWTGKLTNKNKTGSVYEVEATISPVLDGFGNIINFVSVERDITYENKLERQLRQAQKMKAIGTLAGGIAHDLNTDLLPIIHNIDFIIGKIPPESRLQGALKDALKAAYRARDLVSQVLDFSRENKTRQILVKLSPLVRENSANLRNSLPENIVLDDEFDVSSDTILGDPIQIRQIVSNLFRNSVQSMEQKGGRIRITLENVAFRNEAPPVPGMKVGEYIKLSVTDNGEGIAPKDLLRIFEPFFTTKKPRRGTGMGLAVVHGIVKAHGGEITVESELGRGSVFAVYFPLQECSPDNRPSLSEAT